MFNVSIILIDSIKTLGDIIMNNKKFNSILGAILFIAVLNTFHKTNDHNELLRSAAVDMDFSVDDDVLGNIQKKNTSNAPFAQEIDNNKKGTAKEPDIMDKVIGVAQTATVYYNEFVKQNGSITEYINDVKKGFSAVKEENKKVESVWQRAGNWGKFFFNKVVKKAVNVVLGVQETKDVKKPAPALPTPEPVKPVETPKADVPTLPPVGEVPDAVKGGGKPAEGQSLPGMPPELRPAPPTAAPVVPENNIPIAPPPPPVAGKAQGAPAAQGFAIPTPPPAPPAVATQQTDKETADATKPLNKALLDEIQKGKDLRKVDTTKQAQKDAQRASNLADAANKDAQQNILAGALAKRRAAIAGDEEDNGGDNE